jgi:membrane-associated protein
MLDVVHIVQSGGLLVIGLIVFAEVGLLLGFFLPGDTLLIAAGVFAAEGHLPLIPLLIITSVAAIAGDNTGYYIGKRLGPRLFKKEDGVIFRKEHIHRTEKFYAKYGNKTLLVAHFLPIIRTFSPVLAGASNLRYRSFVIFDTIGDIAWAVGVTLLAYYFGSKIPNIDHYIMLTIAAIIALVLLPTLFHVGLYYYKKHRKA